MLCYGPLLSPSLHRLLVPEFSFGSHLSLPFHSHDVTQLLLLREDSFCLQTLPKPPPHNPNKAGGGEGRQMKGKENSFVSQPSCHCPLDEAQLLSGHSRPQWFSPIPSFQFYILYSQHKFPILAKLTHSTALKYFFHFPGFIFLSILSTNIQQREASPDSPVCHTPASLF